MQSDRAFVWNQESYFQFHIFHINSKAKYLLFDKNGFVNTAIPNIIYYVCTKYQWHAHVRNVYDSIYVAILLYIIILCSTNILSMIIKYN